MPPTLRIPVDLHTSSQRTGTKPGGGGVGSRPGGRTRNRTTAPGASQGVPAMRRGSRRTSDPGASGSVSQLRAPQPLSMPGPQVAVPSTPRPAPVASARTPTVRVPQAVSAPRMDRGVAPAPSQPALAHLAGGQGGAALQARARLRAMVERTLAGVPPEHLDVARAALRKRLGAAVFDGLFGDEG